MIKHHKGPLGEFDYDNSIWEIKATKNDFDPANPIMTMEYKLKGNINGSEIEIPYGLVVADNLFKDCSIQTPPSIPATVRSCRSMFEGCSGLRKAPIIPKGVKDCHSMFNGCKSLREAPPKIPDTVQDCRFMFNLCESLKSGSPMEDTLPNEPVHCDSMYYGCTHLTEAPRMGLYVDSMAFTFTDCKKLKYPPVLPKRVETLAGCFKGCERLEMAPSIGEGCEKMGQAFSGCKKLIYPPTIPHTTRYMEGCFEGCKSLTTVPAIPPSVETNSSLSVFSGCSQNVRDKGDWVFKNRGCDFEQYGVVSKPSRRIKGDGKKKLPWFDTKDSDEPNKNPNDGDFGNL